VYACWVLFFRLLTLTFLTYFIISPNARFQDISDSFSSNEVSLMGLSSLLFVGLLYWLTPLTGTSLEEIITRDQIEKKFLPGFIRGVIFAGALICILILLGIYNYLGYFIQFGEAPLELANVFFRMAALACLAYCETFIFHNKLIRYLKGHVPDLGSALFIAVLYAGIKILQFDLGIMQLVTLFLVSISLFYHSLETTPGQSRELNPKFSFGAGFWAAILIVFQPLLSLPLFGNDFSGLLLLRYNSTLLETHAKWAGLNSEQISIWIRFLSGGAGGPLSSFAFQVVLIIDIIRSVLKKR
jgi:hypothetical protein